MKCRMAILQTGIMYFLVLSSSCQDTSAPVCSFDALPVNEFFYASANEEFDTASKEDCYWHCYEDNNCLYLKYKDVASVRKNVSEAVNLCKSINAQLASIRTQAENDKLTGKADQEILIGLVCRNTETVECEKYWLDGSEVNYVNWKEGEPSSSGGNKSCTTIANSGEWSSVDCEERHLFACVSRDPLVCNKT